MKPQAWQLQHGQHAAAAGRVLLLANIWLSTLASVNFASSAAINYGDILPPFPVSCTGDTFSKQSCLFRDVCLQTTDNRGTLVAWLTSSDDAEPISVLHHHLRETFQGVYGGIKCLGASYWQPGRVPAGSNNSLLLRSKAVGTSSKTLDRKGTSDPDTVRMETDVTILWRVERSNQDSYGHALVNEAFAMFLVLQNHFGHKVPSRLQLLAAPNRWHPTLQHVLKGAVTGAGQLFVDKMKSLPEGKSGFCVKHLVVGNGGYVQASRNSLSNSGHSHAHWYAVEPSFFSSANWWDFRRHTLQVHNIPEDEAVLSTAPPLIVLNDKRYGPSLQPDRRMIEAIDQLADQLSVRYPAATVKVVRFRDLSWKEQVQILSRTTVFITTQGSSAFRLVFLPAGATCVMLGAPQNGMKEWKGFHELDRWFPLTYVKFIRYEVSIDNTAEYRVHKLPGAWEPADVAEQYHWWLYNADVRIKMSRLGPMLDSTLRHYIDA